MNNGWQVVLWTVADNIGQYSGGWITDKLSQTHCYFKKSESLSGFTRQETLKGYLKRKNSTEIRWACVFEREIIHIYMEVGSKE